MVMADVSHEDLRREVRQASKEIGSVKTQVAVLGQKVDDHMKAEEKHQAELKTELAEAVDGVKAINLHIAEQKGYITMAAAIASAIWVLLTTAVVSVIKWWNDNG
jgi:signal transduction histidine kinase